MNIMVNRTNSKRNSTIEYTVHGSPLSKRKGKKGIQTFVNVSDRSSR